MFLFLLLVAAADVDTAESRLKVCQRSSSSSVHEVILALLGVVKIIN